MGISSTIEWHPDAHGVQADAGNYFGDAEVTNCWQVRLVNDQNASIINITAAGIGLDWDYDEGRYRNGYAVEVMIEYREFAQAGDDDPESEDVEYDDSADVLAYEEDDRKSGVLLEAARVAVERYAQDARRFQWDGKDAMC